MRYARPDRTERNARQRRRDERSLATFPQHPTDRADDADIAGAAAEIAAEFESNARFIGFGYARDDIARRYQHRRRAEAALQPVLLGKSPAQRRHDRVVIQALYGGDHGSIAHHRIRDARTRRLTVDQNGAGAAYSLLATQMRAGKVHLLAQKVREMHSRLDGLHHLSPVHSEADRFHAPAAWSSARARTAACWRRVAQSVMPCRSNKRVTAIASKPVPSVRLISRASVTMIGRPRVAPMTARKLLRSRSSTTAPIARANSPALRQSLL